MDGLTQQGDVKVRQRILWTDEDIQKLIDMWYANTPTMLIALKLNRSPSSIQTQASRMQLPERDIEQERHRKRWSPAEDTILDQIVFQELDFTALQHYSASRSRTLDAIVARIALRHGQNGLAKVMKGFQEQALSPMTLKIAPTIVQRPAGLRKCMSPTCRVEFITPDPKRIYHCPKCRKHHGYDD